ncbi:MAG: serine hydrolase [Bacteroidota bacterium]
MFTKKVPLYLLFISIVFTGLISIFGFKCFENNDVSNSLSESKSTISSAPLCNLNISRLKGFEFIHPLLFAEPECESPSLLSCKNQIEGIINANKNDGNITSASVYLREFSQAEWISVNSNEAYSPGSLLKVPELIAFYKMDEMKPGFLEKSIPYDKAFTQSNSRTISFESKHIELGKAYTVKELLYYMIVFSDNDATLLLNNIIDRTVFSKVFSDIGFKDPDYNSNDYKMTAGNYSDFFKELYNASYLNFKNSEECLSLLSKSDFKEGMLSGIPANCVVAHKFGEGGFSNTPNFSESGVIYCGKSPFILTVMTKGTDMKKLPKVVADITKSVYEFMSKRS